MHELNAIAHQARRRLSGATLDTTGLVHECYLRLLKAMVPANPREAVEAAVEARRAGVATLWAGLLGALDA